MITNIRRCILLAVGMLLFLALVVWVAPKLNYVLLQASPIKLVEIAVTAVVIALWMIPKLQVMRLKENPSRKMELEDKARATLAQAIGGSLLLVTAYFSWQGIINARDSQDKQFKIAIKGMDNNKEAQKKQFEIAINGQVTDRFIRSIDLLNAEGEKNLTKRLGGIYSLERIAHDSDVDKNAVVSIMSAYVRTHATLNVTSRKKVMPIDIQAALTAIGNANDWSDPDDIDVNDITKLGYFANNNINLYHTDMIGAELSEKNLSNANMRHADLSNADLLQTILYGVDLRFAKLCNADLRETYLVNADLRMADLSGANLSFAHLDGAFMKGAILKNTIFTGVDLSRVIGISRALREKIISDSEIPTVIVDNSPRRASIKKQRRGI